MKILLSSLTLSSLYITASLYTAGRGQHQPSFKQKYLKNGWSKQFLSKRPFPKQYSVSLLSNNKQVDRPCTRGALVIDVKSLWNYWNCKSLVFQFFSVPKGLRKKSRKCELLSSICGPLVIDVQSLWNYWNFKIRVFLLFRY